MALARTSLTSSFGSATGTTTATYTTAALSTSPTAGCMIVLDAIVLFNNSSITSTGITVVDSHSNSYSQVIAPIASGFGVAYYCWFFFQYATAPGSTTLTLTANGLAGTPGGTDVMITPYLFTGQSGTFGPNTINDSQTGSVSSFSASLTTTKAGSIVLCSAGAGSGSTISASTNLTTDESWTGGYNEAYSAHATASTVTPGATTFAVTLSAASAFGGNFTGIEVLPSTGAAFSAHAPFILRTAAVNRASRY